MMDESIRERIAKLELAAENQEKTNEEILKKLNQITTEMTRYKGFLGGIAFFASSLSVNASNIGAILPAHCLLIKSGKINPILFWIKGSKNLRATTCLSFIKVATDHSISVSLGLN